ncbi:MAG: pantoate--beta-alanine ligase [Nitrospirota bacterium]
MKVIYNIREMQRVSEGHRNSQMVIGFVPTMGFFHKGHISLIKEAKRISDISAASIFVNPVQFGKGEDYKVYPVDIDGDIKKAEEIGIDYLFIPSASDIYPGGYKTFIDVKKITESLCGKSRTGHFRGVATIVVKLFNIIKPHKVLLGQKDFQQALVIRELVKDLNMDIDVIVMPTIRERDGLAMSSRNSYLNKRERESATLLYRSLKLAERMIKDGEKSPERILSEMKNIIQREDIADIDYISICDPETLQEIDRIEGKILIALAVFIGKTRLIDNIMVS